MIDIAPFYILIAATTLQPTTASTTPVDSTQGKQQKLLSFKHASVNVVRVNYVQTTTNPKLSQFCIQSH